MSQSKKTVGRPRAAKWWSTTMRYNFSVTFSENPQVHTLLHDAQTQGILTDLVVQALAEYIENHDLVYKDEKYVLSLATEHIKNISLAVGTDKMKTESVPLSTEVQKTVVSLGMGNNQKKVQPVQQVQPIQPVQQIQPVQPVQPVHQVHNSEDQTVISDDLQEIADKLRGGFG
ncbi:TPA: hypothetical protein ACFU2Q_002187 [Neisseria subflava]